jgi:hypothetical protein
MPSLLLASAAFAAAELGELESPIALTSTLNVARVVTLHAVENAIA